MEENIFKCPNELRVSIKKDNGEMVIDEDCCTNLSILVKNTGEIATSFLGAHSPELIKILDKTLKKYFKILKKTLKEEYKKPSSDDIKVIKGKNEENSQEIEKALAKEVDVKIKYEFDSLKDIEKATKPHMSNKKVDKDSTNIEEKKNSSSVAKKKTNGEVSQKSIRKKTTSSTARGKSR